MSHSDIYSVLRKPLVTEKTTFQKEDDNQIFMRRRTKLRSKRLLRSYSRHDFSKHDGLPWKV